MVIPLDGSLPWAAAEDIGPCPGLPSVTVGRYCHPVLRDIKVRHPVDNGDFDPDRTRLTRFHCTDGPGVDRAWIGIGERGMECCSLIVNRCDDYISSRNRRGIRIFNQVLDIITTVNCLLQ